MVRYKNKWFRLSLEKDLKNEDLGFNLHCKPDGIHITVPPPPLYETLAEEMVRIREDLDTEKIVNKIKNFLKDYGVTAKLEKAIYGDNIKIKLKIQNV